MGPLSIEELANGFCLLMANAYRGIEDGEKLTAARRYAGALGAFQGAAEEIARGYLVEGAVLLEESDAAGWTRFWTDFNDRSRLLDLLAGEIQDRMFRNAAAQERYRRGLRLLPLDFQRIGFDGGIFTPPGHGLAGEAGIESAARAYYEYVMGLFHAFNFFGLPHPATQVQTFWGLRAGHLNRHLVP